MRFPDPLTSDEIIELFKKYENGNEKIRNKLIEGNLRLVSNELKKFYNLIQEVSYIEEEDLFEIGCVGLIKAVDSFDYKKNFKFSSYAVKCINFEILMYLRKLRVRHLGDITSLNEPINDDDNLRIDLVKSNDNVEESCIKKEIYKILKEAIDILPDFEKKLILMNYGIGCDLVTQLEISKMFACSRSYVNKKNIQSRQKMKEYILQKYSGLEKEW